MATKLHVLSRNSADDRAKSSLIKKDEVTISSLLAISKFKILFFYKVVDFQVNSQSLTLWATHCLEKIIFQSAAHASSCCLAAAPLPKGEAVFTGAFF